MAQRRKLSSDELADAARLDTAWRRYKETHAHATQEWVSQQCGWKTQGAFYQYVAGVIPLNLRAALKISSALETSVSEISPRLAAMMPSTVADVRAGYASQTRRIPVLDAQQAAITERRRPGYAPESLALDAALADSCGPDTFALIVPDGAMHPDFRVGDLVVVDPELVTQPGDIVVAKLDREPGVILRKYRVRTTGSRQQGAKIQLVPLNEDFATTPLDAEHPGQVIGPVVEHRRILKRKA